MKINYLIADEIRPEASSKQTVLGLFADHLIVLDIPTQLPAGELPKGIERLAFLINVSNIEGKHKYKGQIFDPEGNPHGPEIDFGESELAKNTSRTMVVEAKPFLIKVKGTYNFVLTVDDTKYPLPFTIIDRAQITPAK